MSKDSAHFKAEERKQVRAPRSLLTCTSIHVYLLPLRMSVCSACP